MSDMPAATVVVATRNRWRELAENLRRLCGLPEEPAIVVVDDASTDRTPEIVREFTPRVRSLRLPAPSGAYARTAGVLASATPVVAFSDDDSWWEPGALGRAAGLLDGHPKLGLVAARVVVQPEGVVDPVCDQMARSPLPGIDGDGPDGGESRHLPGVLGFLACGAVLRREAFLSAGGFPLATSIGGEEEPLAIALAARGWRVVFADDVIAHHQPSSVRDPASRRRGLVRSSLLTCWRHQRWPGVAAETARAVTACRGRAEWQGVGDALRQLPAVARHRSVVPLDVERALGRVRRTSRGG